MYTLQLLHTASLGGQDWQEIISKGVQHVYILIRDQQTVKKNDFKS